MTMSSAGPAHPIRAEVETLLAQVDAKLAQAEAALANGPAQGRIDAAGQLVRLKHRKALLVDRLKDFDADPNAPEGLLQGLKQDWFDLVLALDRLVTSG
jgi:hypothetical protein